MIILKGGLSMFYCRENELGILNKRYKDGLFECIIIYGRRRVGKTALISEFCKDKPNIFFSALNAPVKQNLKVLSKAIYQYKEPESVIYPEYNTLDDALAEISRLAKDERLILVIDEYPYLAKADESVTSVLQHIIDHVWSDTRLYLILCGSSMSFMEKQVLGHESPLYGRRTGQLKLEPLTYRETAMFNPQLNSQQNALVYGITGGVPHYINKLGVKDDVDKAILENILERSSYLYEEPENLLKQELREPGQYSAILSTIAGGASKLYEIANKCQMETSACTKYIKNLVELGIVKKEQPLINTNSRRTIYNIDDNFFKFWYRFVPDNTALIASGRIDRVYASLIKPYLSDYMGLIFERMCQDFLLRYADNLPWEIISLGRWWGNDPSQKKEIEIDIVGEVLETKNSQKSYIAGSCKYRNTVVDINELHRLMHYASVFAKGNKCQFVMFSKTGFTDELKKVANDGDVLLYTLDDLM